MRLAILLRVWKVRIILEIGIWQPTRRGTSPTLGFSFTKVQLIFQLWKRLSLKNQAEAEHVQEQDAHFAFSSIDTWANAFSRDITYEERPNEERTTRADSCMLWLIKLRKVSCTIVYFVYLIVNISIVHIEESFVYDAKMTLFSDLTKKLLTFQPCGEYIHISPQGCIVYYWHPTLLI